MFKAKNDLLPGNIQELFSEWERGYNLRGKSNTLPYAQLGKVFVYQFVGWDYGTALLWSWRNAQIWNNLK